MTVPVRQYDAVEINRIVNDPDVRPDVADMGEGEIDLTATVQNRENVLLTGDYGATLCFKVLPGIYEVHTQATRRGRGSWIIKFVRAGSRYMFTQTDCYEITTRIPQFHDAARYVALRAGMTKEFTRPMGCVWRGLRQDMEIFSFRIQDWIKNAFELEKVGREFHTFLHDEADRHGIVGDPHEDDADHNRYVGATIEMIRGGQAAKAVHFYNRWSFAARHSFIRLLSLDPVTVEMDIGLLILDGDTIRFEKKPDSA